MSVSATARLQEALKGLQEMIAGISGGGPGKPTQAGGDAGTGVGQVAGASGPPIQGGGDPGQVGQHGAKPGYGNGGFGPPGLMKLKQKHKMKHFMGIVGGANGMPSKLPPMPAPGQVGGMYGPPPLPGKFPGQVGGIAGPGKMPPPNVHPPGPTSTLVGGQSGPPGLLPPFITPPGVVIHPLTPVQVPNQVGGQSGTGKPTQVGGDSGPGKPS